MGLATSYEAVEPARADVDAMAGPVVLEFGNAWCGYCRAAQPLVARAFSGHDGVRHIKIADGSGRRLGRSFGVKLWPTLVFLRDGKELARLVRPGREEEISAALASIDAGTH
jgi:thioredoxin 1